MSTSDLYILNGKSTRHVAEFRNGWGSGPMAWDYLGAKYTGEAPGINPVKLKKIWALASDSRLGHHEKVALMMTFDRMYIPLDHLKDAAAACEKFGSECEDGRRANHWPAFGTTLTEVANMKHTRHARGVCLSCTSVCDPWIEPDNDYISNAWPIYGPDDLQ